MWLCVSIIYRASMEGPLWCDVLKQFMTSLENSMNAEDRHTVLPDFVRWRVEHCDIMYVYTVFIHESLFHTVLCCVTWNLDLCLQLLVASVKRDRQKSKVV